MSEESATGGDPAYWKGRAETAESVLASYQTAVFRLLATQSPAPIILEGVSPELFKRAERAEAEIEYARQRLDHTAPSLRDAILSAEDGQRQLIDAYRANESKLRTKADTANAAFAALCKPTRAAATLLFNLRHGVLQEYTEIHDALTRTQLALDEAIHERGPGRAVEDVLTAAQALITTIETGIARDGYCPICQQTERVTLQTGYYTHHEGCAFAALDQAIRLMVTV